MQTTTEKAVQIVDPQTGEVIESEQVEGDELVIGTDAVIESLEAGYNPLFIRKLDELEIVPEEEKESLLSLYTGGAIRKLDSYFNTVVEIQGAAILYHGPYKGKDGFNHPGYYFTTFLTTSENEHGELIVLRSSSAGLMLHMAYALNKYGWFLWKEPIKYKIHRGDDGSHRLTNMSRPKAVRVRKGRSGE